MTAASQPHASPLAPLVDAQRLGSAGGQAAIGVAGIVLAIILVMGQISLATSKGIAAHLHASVAHITEGNQVMESVVERAAPAVELEKILDKQAATLANTHDTMVMTNEQMRGIAATTTELDGVVTSMEATSSSLATEVSGMQESTSTMADTLATLPAATQRTHKQLATISSDTTAINTELSAIARKMKNYGLPQALGAPTG